MSDEPTYCRFCGYEIIFYNNYWSIVERYRNAAWREFNPEGTWGTYYTYCPARFSWAFPQLSHEPIDIFMQWAEKTVAEP